MEEDPCHKIPLSRILWSELKMNSYLDTYPGGDKIALEEYASNVGATDFSVGIGEHPHVGQLCEAAKGRDWYALVAVENWNSFVNSLYDAAAYVGLVTTWVSSFPGCIFSTWAPIASAMFDSVGEIAWISFVGVMYVSTAFAYINSVIFVGTGEDRFTRGPTYHNDGPSSTSSPIHHFQHHSKRYQFSCQSSPGLAGINREGSFLNEIPSNFQNNLQKELELSLKLKSLAKFWRLQDPCISSGTNGAFDETDKISYCGVDNIMMNIARAEKNGTGYDPTIYHASLIESKYNYSSEFLTTSAWKCQLKYGVFEYDSCSLHNSTITQDRIKDFSHPGECYFNLPVCDLTNQISRLLEKIVEKLSLRFVVRMEDYPSDQELN
ncbi:hypothetical protein KEM48_000720 [Puccinia striiformis f. sp. tritici PST-130]|nr:hypothetical protein KEM48_000720 [Puccinia striiformis f. sp. tritici PST-130]